MRKQFDKEYIKEELNYLGKSLDEPLEVYLIGGGAMAFRDLKTTTKDIDLVVQNPADLELFRNTLHGLGYDLVQDPGDEYKKLGAQTILENNDGCRFDVFNQQVVNRLVFSESMQERAEPLVTIEDLSVKIASNEDIFLFKTVAGRESDIDDMNTLVQTGLDYGLISEEVMLQTDLLGEQLFITYMHESLVSLTEKHGVTLEFMNKIEELSEKVYLELEVLMEINGNESIDNLVSTLGLSRDRVEELIQDLEDRGKVQVEKESGVVRKIEEKP